MLRQPSTFNRWPLVVSVAALAVSLSHGLPGIRVSHAADAEVSSTQKQALVNLQDAFSGIAEQVEPAVVGIHVEPALDKTASQPDNSDDNADNGDNNDNGDDTPPRDFNPFGDLPFDFGPFSRRGTPVPTPPRGVATGSGVLIQHTGNDFYILTNYHVVEGGGRIKVQLSGRSDEVRGTLVGSDKKTDLAVVKVRLTGPDAERRIADFDNSDNVRVGQWAIAIGNPLDVGETLTVGVISAKGRAIPGRIENSVADYSDMIQTDASINPGNSGGPLVDINGKVIGVNTAIASPSRGSIGIGFAIPSNVARTVAQQLIRNGEVVRGWLGVQTTQANQEITPVLAKAFGIDHGAFVDEVQPDTPASRAGIKAEDVITRWGNTPIRSFRDLSQAVANTPPGQDVPVELVRSGKGMSVTVHTEKRPDEEALQKQLAGRVSQRRPNEAGPAPQTVKAGGITVRALTDAERQAVGQPGVVVTAVAPETNADDAGIGPGVVITRVNQTPIHSVADFKAAMATVGSQAYLLRISAPSGGGAFSQRTVGVQPEDQ